MKKVKNIFIILSILLLSACSNKINYYFDEWSIKSTIDSEYTLDEFIESEYGHAEDEELSNEEKVSFLLDSKKDITILAIKDSKDEYKEDYFKNENDKYLSSYSYEYDYSNFNNNYFMSNCFDQFDYNEDDDFYNIKLSGNYTCEVPITISVKAKNGIEKSNSINIEDDTHNWEVYEEDNNIEFSIRKKKEEIKSITSPIRIGTFVIIALMILAFFGLLAFIKIKKNED